MLLGRDAQLAKISSILAEAGNGRSSVLVVRGEAGIGKSALLSYAEDEARGCVCLSTRATEVEADIPYAHLADILRPVSSAFGQIPERQAAALSGAIAEGPFSAGDRFAVAAATLSLLSAVAHGQPVLVTVDDVQWVDPSSFEVLCFVGHRLHAEGVVMLMALRDGDAARPGVERFHQMILEGLDDRSARQLVGSTGTPLPEPLIRQVVAEAGGNPLALRELPAVLSQRRPSSPAPGLDPLPLGQVLEDAFCRDLRRLPGDTQEALTLLAVLGSVDLEVVDRALEVSGLSHEAVVAAEEAGLVVERAGRVEFRHPLVRAAVHHMASPARRRQVHLWAAEALNERDTPNRMERRAWHLVCAGSGPDAVLAAQLDGLADKELGRANFPTAASLFARSAEVTPDGDAAAGRYLRAAESTRLAGSVSEARELLVRALGTAQDPGLSTVARYYIDKIDMWQGRALAARDHLLDLERVVERSNPLLASLMLTDAGLVAIEGGELALADELSARAVELASTSGDGSLPLPVEVVRAFAWSLSGRDDEARASLARRADEIDEVDALATDLVNQLVLVAGVAHLAIEDVPRAKQLLQRSVSGAQEASAAGVLPFRLGRLAWVNFWQGHWNPAYALADEACQLAMDTGWLAEQPNSLTALARIEAVTGRDDLCLEHAGRAQALAEESGVGAYLAYAELARGMLALSNGEDQVAVDRLEAVDRFAARAAIVDTPLLWWSSDLVEAYVCLGMPEAAERVLSRFEATLASRGTPTRLAVAARCRALLDPDNFRGHLGRAMAWHDKSAVPFERARTQLTLGRCLRRSRSPGDAREHLRAALDVFTKLGAARWSERCRAELAAAGVRLPRSRQALSALTPQELQVALHVAQGLPNREVAARLFLSVKTVEFHLGNVFQKLGVNRRTELAVLVAKHDLDEARSGQPAAARPV